MNDFADSTNSRICDVDVSLYIVEIGQHLLTFCIVVLNVNANCWWVFNLDILNLWMLSDRMISEFNVLRNVKFDSLHTYDFTCIREKCESASCQ